MGYDYYVAEFVGPAYGTIEFHPVLEGGIQITTNLRGDEISLAHMLHVHEAVIAPGANCGEAGDHVDSWSTNDPGYACNPNTPELCHVGDISGKHGHIDLGVEFEEIDFAIDYNLFLSNLTNRSLVLHDKLLSTDRFACANLIGKMYPEYLSVNFSDTYWGAMIFRSRSDGTVGIVHKMQTHIGDSVEHRYHIHEDPITLSINGSDPGSRCYVAGPHFDPTEAEDDSLYYNPPQCTPDGNPNQCFYGDLEGKYGPLSLVKPSGSSVGLSRQSVQDFQLRIPDIWKRSVVIHQSGGDLERILCDTLQPQEFTEAEAVFSGDVTGEMKFRMHNDGTMRISYNLRNSNFQSSNNHKIHIHVDNVLPEGGCGTAGGHYDPMVVEIDGYSCDPSNVATCYFGDLSGKFGQANFPAAGSWRDEQLTVSEIIGRSIVIHVSDGAPRYDCATITPTASLPKLGIAEFDDMDGLHGYVLFREQSNGDVLFFTTVRDASGETDLKLMVTDSDTYGEDCFSSGDLFNPTHAQPHNALGSLSDRYHFNVGDLLAWIDVHDDMKVPALVGGSVVITRGNERIACESISQYPVVNYAEAFFSVSFDDIWGTVKFRTMGEETMISFNLVYADESFVDEMTWYITEDVLSDCQQMTTVWDPFMIGNSQSCNRNSFATCMVGDFSSKHGDLIFPATGYKYDGSFSVVDVVGRAIVIVDGSGHRHCANIIPRKYEAQTAAAEFLQGIVIFRKAASSTSVVYSLIGENPQASEVFIKDSCEDELTEPFTSNVLRPSMFVESTDMKVSDLIGKFMILDGECVEIQEVMENSDTLDLDAVAPFDGNLMGDMEFTRLNETDMSGFSFKIMLENTDGSPSQRHKFHVHNYPVVEEQGCGSAGGHFDPLVVEIDGYSCDPDLPISTCYYGDLSGRYEMKLPFPLETTLIDSDVPLMDLVGRSIVIHEKDNGGPRYDCATIFPIPRTLTGAPTPSPTNVPVSTSSTTPRPSRSPVTPSPTSFTTSTTSDTDISEAVTVTESSSGSNTGLILGILLPLLFCCICIPLGYFAWKYYEERDMPDALKNRMPHFDFECPEVCSTCPSWCATTIWSHTAKPDKKSAFHLGRYTTPQNSGFNVADSTDSLKLVHNCPHGLKTFVVDEPDWFCSSCQKQMIIGETMMGCRICNVDQCFRCNELHIAPRGSANAPPALPMIPNGLSVPHRQSRLSMQPPSRSASRDNSMQQETLPRSKGLPKRSTSSQASHTGGAVPPIPNINPPAPPAPSGKRLPSVVRPTPPKVPVNLPSEAKPTPPKAPAMLSTQAKAPPTMSSHVYGRIASIAPEDSDYMIPFGPTQAPPTMPIPPRSSTNMPESGTGAAL